MNLNEMIENEIENGYGYDNARSKVFQDIILKAISESSLSRNVTIKDGVIRRVDSAFRSRTFINRLESSDKRWLDEDVEELTGGILEILENIKQSDQGSHD